MVYNDKFILFALHLLKEEFLDIPVALAGCNMLEERLKESFITMETLDGSNQYHCDSCDQLVDAKRVSWLVIDAKWLNWSVTGAEL